VSLRRVAAIVVRQYYLIRGSVARVFPLFSWIALDIVLWGFITKYLRAVTQSPVVGTFLGAVLLWDFFMRIMQAVTMAFFEDVWSRNFLNFFASPLRVSEYLAGLVATSICTGAAGLIIMLLIATLAFGLSYFAYGLLLVPYLLVLFLFGIGLGIFGAGVSLRLGPASEWFIWPIPTILAPFGGVFYPIATLPRWMQWIARLIPPSYVFESMRAIVAGRPAPLAQLAIAIALAAASVALGCWYFTRMYRRGVRTGVIARYSAETIS
jgi:ABC-2 type transport system permease protein